MTRLTHAIAFSIVYSIFVTSGSLCHAKDGPETGHSLSQMQEKATYAERVKGDRSEAIRYYERILARHKTNRAVAESARKSLKRLKANSEDTNQAEQKLTPRVVRVQSATLRLDDLEKAIRTISEQYAGDVKGFSDESLEELIKNLDRYSAYIDPNESKDLMANINGELVGIGVALKLEDDAVVIQTVIPESPASKAGLFAGEQIVSVDGAFASEIASPDRLKGLVSRLRGKAGQPVMLKLQSSDGETQRNIELRRAKIKLSTVQGVTGVNPNNGEEKQRFQLADHPEIGYVKISSISHQTAADCRKILSKLAGVPIKGLVIDLRNCVGGLLSGATEIADMLLSEGLIVSVEGRRRQNEKFTADELDLLHGVPIVVLVSRNTASSAEIVAGALKQNERAIVIGERTFGKGSVQSLVSLGNGALLRLTTAEFFLAGHMRLEKPDEPKEGDRWGVDPSDGFEIEFTDEEESDIFSGKHELPDRALKKAVEHLNAAT